MEEAKETILERLVIGDSLADILLGEGMPERKVVYRWLNPLHKSFDPDFFNDYHQASSDSAYKNFEDIEKIANDTELGLIDPQSARVAIEALKWIAGKKKPERYGDRVSIDHSGKISHTSDKGPDLSKWTEEELKTYRELIKKLDGPAN